MAESSFGGHGPLPSNDDSKTKLIFGSMISVTILATIAVILRFVARKRAKVSFSYGTYLSNNVLHIHYRDGMVRHNLGALEVIFKL